MNRPGAPFEVAEPGFREVLRRIPDQPGPSPPPDWLRWEMVERDEVLRQGPSLEGLRVVEIGSGPHAIATVPLAFRVGPSGRVLALERSRWGRFRSVTEASGLEDRVDPVGGDVRRLPLRADSADLAVCLHAVRSLGSDASLVRVLREMLRVAPRLLLAESLPIARTPAQRAHLAMYTLREEVLSGPEGAPEDRHYLPLDRILALVEEAGGRPERAEVLEVDLPHFLARFPRSLVEQIPDPTIRDSLLLRWDQADVLCQRDGEDHPPVGIVTASRPY